jgi:U6 snRNA-associated Sm-like protein LSm8
MASTLSEWKSKPVSVLTCDGRLIVGTLQGYDQLQNLILCKSYEKVYSVDSPMEKVELGLFVVRGDNVAIISDGGCGKSKSSTGDNEDEGKEEEEINDYEGSAEPIMEISGNR